MSSKSPFSEEKPTEEITLLEEKHSKRHTRDHKRTTVRFTDEQYDRIESDAKLSGESLPTLLKSTYFRRRKLTLLFTHSDALSICNELRRIGNNVNQIARAMNTGAREGWYPAIEQAAQVLTALLQEVSGQHGVR